MVQTQYVAVQQIHARLVNVNAVQDKHVQARRPNVDTEHVCANIPQTVMQRLRVPAHLLVYIRIQTRLRPVNVDQTRNVRGHTNAHIIIAVISVSKVCMLNYIHVFELFKTT